MLATKQLRVRFIPHYIHISRSDDDDDACYIECKRNENSIISLYHDYFQEQPTYIYLQWLPLEFACCLIQISNQKLKSPRLCSICSDCMKRTSRYYYIREDLRKTFQWHTKSKISQSIRQQIQIFCLSYYLCSNQNPLTICDFKNLTFVSRFLFISLFTEDSLMHA